MVSYDGDRHHTDLDALLVHEYLHLVYYFLTRRSTGVHGPVMEVEDVTQERHRRVQRSIRRCVVRCVILSRPVDPVIK